MVANKFVTMDQSVEDFFSQPMSTLSWLLRSHSDLIKEDTVVISEDESSQQIFNSNNNIDLNTELIDLTTYDPMEFENMQSLNICDLTTDNINPSEILNEFLFSGSGVKSDEIKPEEICKTETNSNLQCSPMHWFKCTQCQYISLSKKALEEHEMKHSNCNSKTQHGFKCIGCPNIFYSLKSLIPHLENDHLLDMEDINNVISAFLPNNPGIDKSIPDNFLESQSQNAGTMQDVFSERDNSNKNDNSSKNPASDNFKIFLRGVDNSTLLPSINEEYISVLTDEMLGINADLNNKQKSTEVNNNRDKSNIYSAKCMSDNTTAPPPDNPPINKFELTFDPNKSENIPQLHYFDNTPNTSVENIANNQQDQPKIKLDNPKINMESNVDVNNFKGLSQTNTTSYMYFKPSKEDNKLQDSTSNKLEPEIKCTYPGCSIKMRRKDSILYHGRCHINESNVPVCPECVKYFSSWQRLHTHLWKVHKIDVDMYACTKCDFKTHTLWMLNDVHSKIHLNEYLYKCTECDHSFKSARQLRYHKTTHKKNAVVNKCNICEKEFALKRSLERHISNVHERIKNFLCSICGYNTATSTDLMLHYKGHGDKTLFCEHCDYRTHDHNTIRKHKLRHSVQRVYKCKVCKYETIQAGAIKRHMKSKHPKKLTTTYMCSVCDYSTINSKNFNAHINIHKHTKKSNENYNFNSNIFSSIKNTTPDSISDGTESINTSSSPVVIQNHSNIQSLNPSSIIRGTQNKQQNIIQNEYKKNIKGQIKVKSNLVLKGPGSLINTGFLLSNYQTSNNTISIRKPSDLNLIQDVTLKPLKLTDKIQPMSVITRAQNENRTNSPCIDSYSNDVGSKPTWSHHLDETSGIEYIDLDFD